MPTQLALVNEALAQIGTRSQLTTLVSPTPDPQPERVYANALYAPIRDFLLAEGDYDFSLVGAVLAPASVAVLAPWTLAYGYPADALRIRQLIPTVFDINDPRPVTWNISSVSGSRQIYTNTAMSSVVYTKAVNEALWDSLFSEPFVRMLASGLSYALKNSAEGSKLKLDEALSFLGIASMRDQ